MKKALFTGVLAILFILSAFSQMNTKPIISSQNFRNKTELWESVGNGILNFQADVMYIYGKLYVTSLMPDSASHMLPTLTEAYLYPLFNQFKKYNGEMIAGYQGDIFLILNISSQPVQVYKKLVVEMRPFADMLTYEFEGAKHPGKLRLLLKDKEQLDEINSFKPSFLGLVGNSGDIEKNIDSFKMPLIEINFNEITNWNGTGNIPFEDFVKLKDLVAKIHAQKKQLSLSNCPLNKAVADLIQTSKADYINTDEAVKMGEFFETNK
jgi:hypothetical protein